MLIALLCSVIVFLIGLIAVEEKEIKRLKYREQTHIAQIDKLSRKLMRRK